MCRAVKYIVLSAGNLFGDRSSNVINFEIYIIPLFSYSRKLGFGGALPPPPQKKEAQITPLVTGCDPHTLTVLQWCTSFKKTENCGKNAFVT